MDRYDFDSIRVGVQPFSSDFRGFLFNDNQLGIRLFGTRDNNRFQYNVAWIRRLEKDTNSGLNNLIELGSDAFRDDDVFVANLYRQDFPRPGFTSQVVVAHNRNREGGDLRYDDNGFIQRPSSLGLERARDYVQAFVLLTQGHDPALAAALSGVTPLTSTPLLSSGRPKACASSGVNG